MLYENLPGINVTLKDGGLILPERGDSETILIVAPSLAQNAPDEPALVRSSSELVSHGFGDFYVAGEVNPIAAEWKAATDAGAKAVYLVALKEIDLELAAELEQAAIAAHVAKGETLEDVQAKFQNILTADNEQAIMRRKFIYFYNLLMGTLLDFSVDHVVLKGVTLEDEATELDAEFFPEVQNAEDFPFISGMVNSSYVLTSDTLSYPLTIAADTSDKLVLNVDGTEQTLVIPPKVYDGNTLTVVELEKDLQAVFDAAPAGIKVNVHQENGQLTFYFAEPVSVVAEKTTANVKLSGQAVWEKTSLGLITRGSFAQTVADYCATKTLMKSSTLGYIGVRPPVDTKISTIRKYVNDLTKLDTEISPYLQVVGSEVGVVMPITNNVHFVNGATHYAALVSNLAKESATTNKTVPGVKAVRFDYSLRQLSLLTDKKIVTFKLKNGTDLVVTDGVTTAPYITVGSTKKDSDFAHLSTLRITQLSIEVVREAVEPFIGEANGMPEYNALNTAIKSALEKIREAGAIRGYRFSISNVTARLDEATVVLEIVPAFELRRVEVQVNLTANEEILASLGL